MVYKEFFNCYGDSKFIGVVFFIFCFLFFVEIFIFVVLFVVDIVCCFWECWFIELVDFCEKEGLDGCFIDKLIFDDFSKDFFNFIVLY